MSGITRRRFFGSAAAALPIGLIAAAPAIDTKSTGLHADIIVTGGKLLTMDARQPVAEAMAVRGQHILAVGSADAIANLRGPQTKIIDATGMTVSPGFIDAHSHPVVPAHGVSVNVNLRRIAQVKDALRQQAAKTPPGQAKKYSGHHRL